METDEMNERALGNRLLDQVEDVVRLTDRDVDTKHSEEMFVFRVVDARDRAGHVKLLPRDLADHEVVLVFPGYRNNDVSARGAGRGLRPRLGPVPGDCDSAEHLVDLRDTIGVTLNE